jgi:hypothetical protein
MIRLNACPAAEAIRCRNQDGCNRILGMGRDSGLTLEDSIMPTDQSQ